MRIGFPALNDEFDTPEKGGVRRVMYELYNNLNAIKEPDMVMDKVKFTKLPYFDEGFSPSIKSTFYDFSKYDIIHNLAPRPLYLLRKGKAITLTTFHDFRVLVAPNVRDEDKKGIKRRLGTYLVLEGGARFALKCDYMCASSTQTKDEAISLGYPKERVFLVNLGVDKRFTIGQSKGRDKKIFKVGHIGAIGTTKNQKFAIDAFNKLDDGNTVLEIWGNPLSSVYYKTLTDASKSNSHIAFKGIIPEEDLVKIYDSFDAFVYPSKYEGFGLHIIEAQARGLPVILYKSAMIPNEVRKYCLEAEDEAHMAELIGDIKENGYNKRKRKKAMEYARSFTWEKTASKTLEIYDKIKGGST